MQYRYPRIAAIVASRWLPAAILLLGLLVRVAWLATTPVEGFAKGEMANVAIAFANTGTLADSFRPGQGPTAHVSPIPPVYAGLIYRAFGVRSAASEAILAAVAIGVALASFALLFAVFGRLGTPRWARLLALAAACVLPLDFSLEAIDFRIWEGGFVTLLELGFLLALVRLDRAGEIGTGTIAALALAAAVIAFSSPAIAPGLYLCSLLLLVDRVPPRRWPVAAALAAVALAAVITPWALRNERAVGAPVLLRSNAGLELALGNHAAAVATTDERRTFRARLDEIHPFESDRAYAAMQRAGGEVAYARALGATASAWAKAHPTDFARLSLRHLREFFFPAAWQWNVYSEASRGVGTKQALQWLLTAAGIAGALAALIRAPHRYRYAVIMLFVPALPYVIVQPILRYRYLIYGLSIFFAADLAGWLWQRLPGREPRITGYGYVNR